MIWDDEMSDHFREEESLLIPLASPEMGQRLCREHLIIAELIEKVRAGNGDEECLRSLGEHLQQHIRWEERELFPEVEKSEALSSIAERTNELEKRREGSPHSPRRGLIGHEDIDGAQG